MGRLFYGGADAGIEFDDRTLAHLEYVITAKLRRSESFTLTWTASEGAAAGRTTIWLAAAVPLRFDYDARTAPRLDTAWLERLAKAAHSSAGIVVDRASTPADDRPTGERAAGASD